ncbi:rRNA-processing protein EFG1-like [Helianthus annuus]|uniref:rRNA-processing protein EFG1-like n=1 Tax=Helianthus annuus TaxID=4232 RepID=UPI000B901233|nr:rRNA-processing protein EFG1-like [Helianthus annuus]
MYMMNKVLENLIGKPVEQRFEEIELEEVRARCKAEIAAEMKNKGKGVQVEGVSEVTKRSIVPSIVPESPIQNPCPISSVSGVFDDDVEIDDVENDDEEDDEEEVDDEEIMKDDADDVFSSNSDHDDDDNDDNDQGSTGIKVTEASTKENVDDYLHDDANEESENAESEGEPDDTKNVDESDDHVTRLILCL